MHAGGVGTVITFHADLQANTLSVQLHRPLNETFPDAKALPTPSPVLRATLPADKPLGDMRPLLGLWGLRVTFCDIDPGDVFPRLSHD
jgi:hypothetical protein